MKEKKSFLFAALLFSILSLGIVFYAMAIPRESEFLMLQALFIYLSVLGLVLVWNITLRSKMLDEIISEILSKHDDFQRILLDLRDGTKKFYEEKRRSARIKTDMLAKFADKTTGDDFVKLDEISFEGARIKTTRSLKVGEIVKLGIYLPFFPRPISTKARIVRVRPTAEIKGALPVFEAGIEYTEVPKEDHKQIVETLNILKKSSGKTKRR